MVHPAKTDTPPDDVEDDDMYRDEWWTCQTAGCPEFGLWFHEDEMEPINA